jgi:hypothetical protein
MTEETLTAQEKTIIKYVDKYGFNDARLLDTDEEAPPESPELYLDKDFFQRGLWGEPKAWQELGLDEDALFKILRDLENRGYLHTKAKVHEGDTNEYYVTWIVTDRGREVMG